MPRSIQRFVQVLLTWFAILALTTQPAAAQFLCGSGSGYGSGYGSGFGYGSAVSAGWSDCFVTSDCCSTEPIAYCGESYNVSYSAMSCCGPAGWDCGVGVVTDTCGAECVIDDCGMPCETDCGRVDCGYRCSDCGTTSHGVVVEGGVVGCSNCQSGVTVDQSVVTEGPVIVEDSGTSIEALVAPIEPNTWSAADDEADIPPTPPAATTDAVAPRADFPPFEEPPVVPAEADEPAGFGEAEADMPAEGPADGMDDLFGTPDTEPAGDLPAEEPAGELDDLFGEPATEPAGPMDELTPPADSLPPAANEGLEPPAEENGLGEELDDLFGQTRPGQPSPERTWVDNTGRYRTSGRLAQIGDSYVRLLKENGRYCTVPLDRLSDSDFDFVQQLASKLGRAPLVRVANR